MRKLLLVVGLVAMSAPAMAQNSSYTIQRPGQPSTSVESLGNNSYIVRTPGQPAQTVGPDGSGGYIVQTPGQPATFIHK
jgi:hypothetical protein